jgi:hypothetical protein
MCLNKAYSKEWKGKHLPDAFPIQEWSETGSQNIFPLD